MTVGKRTLDVIFAAVLFVLLAPLMLFVAWRIWRAKDGPVFYVAERMKTPHKALACGSFGP